MNHRDRTLSLIILCAGLAGCAPEDGAAESPDDPAVIGGEQASDDPGDDPGDDQRIEAGLDRLEALDVMELGALFEVGLSASEQADRVEALADRAEVAVAEADYEITGDWSTPDSETLCVEVNAQADEYCLTRDMHQDDLDALNGLEIVEVTGIVREAQESTGFCYTSWDPVTRVDCERAYELRAVVEATTDLGGADRR